jgi:hypothetical protein
MKNVKAAAIAMSVLTVGTGAFAVGFRSVVAGPQQPGERAAATAEPGTENDAASATDLATSTSDQTEGGATDGASTDAPATAQTETFAAEAGSPGPDGPVDPIGGVSTTGIVPEGLDLTSFPGAPAPGDITPFDGPDGFSAGPGCAYQCIVSGVAYPRGFGAQLVVETKVPADLFLSVIADTDGDGDWDVSEFVNSPSAVKSFSWELDHLEPGQLHYAMVAATDEHGDTSYAWGELTTLSTRSVEVAVTSMAVHDGPSNVVETTRHIRLDEGEYATYELGDWAEWDEVDRNVDVDLYVTRFWEASVCEVFWSSYFEHPQGDSDDACAAWNTATAEIDLDRLPGADRWTSHTFEADLHTPTGAGNALPTGYGDPRHFHVEATATVHVTYR